jgi:hypothetical protein
MIKYVSAVVKLHCELVAMVLSDQQKTITVLHLSVPVF